MNILLITHSQDNESIPMVMEAIEDQGGKAFRFDTDHFPTEIQLESYYHKDATRLILTTDTWELDLSSVSSVWYRRIAIGHNIPDTMDKQLLDASMDESDVTVQGMLASLDAFLLDPLPHIRRAEHKQLQLQVARELGLIIPRTLTTNDPEAVRAFARATEQGIIVKMLSSFAIYEKGQEKVVFTNPLTSEDLDQLNGLRYCPMTFQEQIPKALELRTTIVGRRVFTAAVDSQRLQEARHDWRRQGIALLDYWGPYELPEGIESRLLDLIDRFGLNYGAIDLILTPDGRHVFLEINPVGEFFWLELCPGLPISQAIAEVLLEAESQSEAI